MGSDRSKYTRYPVYYNYGLYSVAVAVDRYIHVPKQVLIPNTGPLPGQGQGQGQGLLVVVACGLVACGILYYNI